MECFSQDPNYEQCNMIERARVGNAALVWTWLRLGDTTVNETGRIRLG